MNYLYTKYQKHYGLPISPTTNIDIVFGEYLLTAIGIIATLGAFGKFSNFSNFSCPFRDGSIGFSILFASGGIFDLAILYCKKDESQIHGEAANAIKVASQVRKGKHEVAFTPPVIHNNGRIDALDEKGNRCDVGAERVADNVWRIFETDHNGLRKYEVDDIGSQMFINNTGDATLAKFEQMTPEREEWSTHSIPKPWHLLKTEAQDVFVCPGERDATHYYTQDADRQLLEVPFEESDDEDVLDTKDLEA